MKALADIGLIGLAVMGENLVMNMESKGFTVAVYNRTTSKVTNFVEGRAKGKNSQAGSHLSDADRNYGCNGLHYLCCRISGCCENQQRLYPCI